MHRSTCACAILVFSAGIRLIWGDTIFTGNTGSGAAIDNRQPTLITAYMIALQGTLPDNTGGTPGNFTPNRSTPFLGEIRSVSFSFVPSGWVFCEGQTLTTSQNAALFNLIGYTYGGSGANFNLPDLRERAPIGAGQGNGLPNYSLGNVVGAASTTLSVANLPPHTHSLSGGGNTVSTGSGAPLENRQPSIAVNYLIAGDGEIMIAPWSVKPAGWALCDGSSLSTSTYSSLFNVIHYTFGGSGASFNLPDLRGRAVIGDDDTLQPYPIGTTLGSNSVTLAINDIPAHTHTVTGSPSTGSTGGAGFSASNYQPSLTLRWVISLFGSFPNAGPVSFPCVGELRLIAANNSPGIDGGWMVASGQLLAISADETLFNLIGTTYGGDGQVTFALPDFRHSINSHFSNTNTPAVTYGTDFLSINVSKLAPHAHALVQASITNIQHFTNTSAQLTLTGTLGSTWKTDFSNTLPATWNNLGTVNFGTATQMISDPNPAHVTTRFYYAHDP